MTVIAAKSSLQLCTTHTLDDLTLPRNRRITENYSPALPLFQSCCCILFAWQGFGRGGATRMTSARSCQKLPHVWLNQCQWALGQTDHGSRLSPSVMCGRASWDNTAKNGKKANHRTATEPEEWEYVIESTLQTPSSVQEGKEVLQASEKRFPCSPWKSMGEQRSRPAAHGGAPNQSRWIPKGGSDLMGSSHWRRVLADLWPCGEMKPHWYRFAGGGHPLEQFVKNCGLWEELMLEKFMECSFLRERPHVGAGESVESLTHEEEGGAEITHDATLFPEPLCYCGEGGRGDRWWNWACEEGRGGGKGVLRFFFFFLIIKQLQ